MIEGVTKRGMAVSDLRHANERHARRPSNTGHILNTQWHNNRLYCAGGQQQGRSCRQQGSARHIGSDPIRTLYHKSSIKGPVVLVTNFTLKSSPLSTKEEISDPGSELAAAEAGLIIIHTQCMTYMEYFQCACRSVTYNNKLLSCTDY